MFVTPGVVQTLRQGDIRRRTPQARPIAQANALLFGSIGIVGLQIVTIQAVQPFEQAEEIVLRSFGKQAIGQIRGWVPLRIGHA